MIRHAPRQFTGWTLVTVLSVSGLNWAARCPECPTLIGPVDDHDLPTWLDRILDHDWEHSPESGSAPIKTIDTILGAAS